MSLGFLCFVCSRGISAAPVQDDFDFSASPEVNALQELIYQAEVFGRTKTALNQLRDLLWASPDREGRAAVIRAIAIVNYPLPRVPLDEAVFSRSWPQPPRAVVIYGNDAFLLVADQWVRLGDWVGDRYIREIGRDEVILVDSEGFQSRLPLPPHPAQSLSEGPGCFLFGAQAGEILSFISRQNHLNSFIPSGINRRLNGFFPVEDWLSLLTLICSELEISWTRRRDNVMFHQEKKVLSLGAETIRQLNRKNENLAEFLHNLALRFDMELILDEGLGDINVDINLEDQPWDELLDCLALLNGFTWFLVREPGEKTKLVIQRG